MVKQPTRLSPRAHGPLYYRLFIQSLISKCANTNMNMTMLCARTALLFLTFSQWTLFELVYFTKIDTWVDTHIGHIRLRLKLQSF
ncbi:hypothetical protein SERLADRAFT_458824, partial [Serpula lacrymans var. lacrymans S7.9]